jgi:hypothetical protein
MSYSHLKKHILKCIAAINKKRILRNNVNTNLSIRKSTIMKFIKIYRFYKLVQFKRNLQRNLQHLSRNCAIEILKTRIQKRQRKAYSKQKRDIINYLKAYYIHLYPSKKMYKAMMIMLRFIKKIAPKVIIPRNSVRSPKSPKSPKVSSPKTILKDGFMFILIDGTYRKVTKKGYSIDEIKQWGKNRQNTLTKRKQIIKKTKRQNLNKKEDRINQIYAEELIKYPSCLRQLIGNF